MSAIEHYECGWCHAPLGGTHAATCSACPPGEAVRRWQCNVVQMFEPRSDVTPAEVDRLQSENERLREALAVEQLEAGRLQSENEDLERKVARRDRLITRLRAALAVDPGEGAAT